MVPAIKEKPRRRGNDGTEFRRSAGGYLSGRVDRGELL